MIEAVRTTATPIEIGAIVVIAISCLAFWLGMIAVASTDPGGVRRRRRRGEMMGPVVGGTHVSDCRRSVAPNRRSAAVFASHEEEVFFGTAAGSDAVSSGAAGSGAVSAGPAPAVPGQRAGEPAPAAGQQATPAAGQQPTPAMPAQRSGEAGQPRPAGASPADRP